MSLSKTNLGPLLVGTGSTNLDFSIVLPLFSTVQSKSDLPLLGVKNMKEV